MAEERTNARLAAEIAFALLVGFGALILLLAAERRGALESSVALALAVAYGLLVGFIVNSGEGHTLAERCWNTGRKRIGIGIFSGLFLTVVAYAFPLRIISLFAVFIFLEALTNLLPGRVIFYGEELWKQSRIAYILAAAVSIMFLFTNLFSVPAGSLIWIFSSLSGVLFSVLMLAVLALIVAAFFGKRLSGNGENNSGNRHPEGHGHH